MWRDVSGALDAHSGGFFFFFFFSWVALWVSNGHFFSSYYLRERAIEYGEKRLSESVRKCQNVKYMILNSPLRRISLSASYPPLARPSITTHTHHVLPGVMPASAFTGPHLSDADLRSVHWTHSWTLKPANLCVSVALFGVVRGQRLRDATPAFISWNFISRKLFFCHFLCVCVCVSWLWQVTSAVDAKHWNSDGLSCFSKAGNWANKMVGSLVSTDGALVEQWLMLELQFFTANR